MAELKTKPTGASVAAFLAGIADDTRRAECETLLALMEKAAKAPAAMWGPSIVGFGTYHYTYPSGQEADWFPVGFSPRKGSLTLYLMPGLHAFEELLSELGKVKHGKSCIYVKKLADIDLGVLRKMVALSVKTMKNYKPAGPVL